MWSKLIHWLLGTPDSPFNRSLFGKNITRPILIIRDSRIINKKLTCIRCRTPGAMGISKDHDGRVLKNITCPMCGQSFILQENIIRILEESN